MINKPQAIKYTTPQGHTVVLDDPEKLVVKQDIPCIDGGYAKINGKTGQLFVRYDNKPELAAQIADWQKAWDEYTEWFAEQVEITKQSIQCNEPGQNFDKAENDEFTWTYWDGTSGKTLIRKPANREIYQMRYTDNGEAIEGDEKTKVMIFWQALKELQKAPRLQPPYTAEETARIEKLEEYNESEPEHGISGYCRKCHSYCWGDCEAN